MVKETIATAGSLIAKLQEMDPTTEIQYLVLDSGGAISLMDLDDGQVDLLKLCKAFKKPVKLAATAPTPEIAEFQVGADTVTVHKRQDGRYLVRVNGVDKLPDCTASEAIVQLAQLHQGAARD